MKATVPFGAWHGVHTLIAVQTSTLLVPAFALTLGVDYSDLQKVYIHEIYRVNIRDDCCHNSTVNIVQNNNNGDMRVCMADHYSLLRFFLFIF